MVEAIIVGVLALVIGGALILVVAFGMLVVSLLASEETSLRFASPARARLLDSTPSVAGTPARSGFINGLIRCLRVARKANQVIHRDART